MSLTPQEERAGLSRMALETIRRNEAKNNGNGRESLTTQRPRSVAEIMSGYIAHRVIDTPMRQIDVLERTAGGDVLIRETCFEAWRATVTFVVLTYPEAHALADTLSKLEPRDEMTARVKGAQ